MQIRPDPNCSVQTDRQTDRHEEIIAFRNFANAPKREG